MKFRPEIITLSLDHFRRITSAAGEGCSGQLGTCRSQFARRAADVDQHAMFASGLDHIRNGQNANRQILLLKFWPDNARDRVSTGPEAVTTTTLESARPLPVMILLTATCSMNMRRVAVPRNQASTTQVFVLPHFGRAKDGKIVR